MRRSRLGIAIACLVALLTPLSAAPQPARVYRVGVIYYGGPHSAAVGGLREGLRELGWEEGKRHALVVRDAKGDLKTAETAARELERDNVDLIYSFSTSITLAARRATTRIPIVFYAGSDPVASGLVETYRRPGGRCTGVHGQQTDLTAKRLQLLKEIVPNLRRVVTFYSPDNPATPQSMRDGRDAARQLKVELVERPIHSVKELRAGLQALRPGEVDAFFYVPDAMVTSQTEAIIEVARAKKLPVMFQEPGSVTRGALAAYGVSYHVAGRLAARQVQRVLEGANPGELPVEQLDKLYLALNLKTAQALGLTIPPAVLLRADEVVQ